MSYIVLYRRRDGSSEDWQSIFDGERDTFEEIRVRFIEELAKDKRMCNDDIFENIVVQKIPINLNDVSAPTKRVITL